MNKERGVGRWEETKWKKTGAAFKSYKRVITHTKQETERRESSEIINGFHAFDYYNNEGIYTANYKYVMNVN